MASLKTRLKKASGKDVPLGWRVDKDGIGWLENGHWMIHQGLMIKGGLDVGLGESTPESQAKLIGAQIDRSVEVHEGAGIDHVLKGASKDRAFSPTNVLVDSSRYLCRLLETEVKDPRQGVPPRQVFVRDDYLKLPFGDVLPTLHGKDSESILSDEDRTFLVAPIRVKFPYTRKG